MLLKDIVTMIVLAIAILVMSVFFTSKDRRDDDDHLTGAGGVA